MHKEVKIINIFYSFFLDKDNFRENTKNVFDLLAKIWEDINVSSALFKIQFFLKRSIRSFK